MEPTTQSEEGAEEYGNRPPPDFIPLTGQEFRAKTGPTATMPEDPWAAYANQKYQAIKEKVEDPRNLRAGLEIAGSIAGSKGGSLLARGAKQVPDIAGRMLGAGAGGAAGSVASETFDPTKSPGESALAAGGAAMTGEGLGSATIGITSKAFGPKALEPGAQQAMDIVRKRGGIVTPASATNTRLIDIAENAAESSIIGGGMITQAKKGAEHIIQDEVKNFANAFRMSASKEETGALIQDLIEDGIVAHGAAARIKFGAIDALVPGGNAAPVNYAPMKQWANEQLKSLDAGLSTANPQLRSILEDVISKPDNVSFKEAQTLRSDLLSAGRSTTDLMPGRLQGTTRKMAEILDREMMNTAKAIGPDAYAAWREANAFWKEGKETYNSKVVKALANRDPEAVFDYAIRNGRPGTIRKIRNVVNAGGNPDDWTAIQGQWLDDWIKRSADEMGNISGKRLLQAKKSFGEESLAELFPDQATRTRLHDMALGLARVQAKPQDTTLRLAVQFGQAGAVVGLATGNLELGEAGAILLAPAALGKILTNPMGSRLLVKGLRAPKGTETSTRIATNFMSWLGKERFLQVQNPGGPQKNKQNEQSLDAR